MPWLAALAFAGGYTRVRTSGEVLAEGLREANERLIRTAQTSSALFEHLSSQEIPTPFLEGIDAESGLPLRIEDPVDGIVVLLDTKCQGCQLTYPFLEDLVSGAIRL